MPNLKKSKIVEEIKEKLARANLILMTDYRGMKVADVQNLKNDVRSDEAEYAVVKNTLLRVATDDRPILQKEFESLEGPTAVLFCYKDEVAPLKKLLKFAKTLELPKMKFAFMKDLFLGEADITRLSSLPSRDILVGQVVGTIGSPLYRLQNALSFNLRGLATQINQIKENKNSN